jgi:hypothetical protein
MSKSTLHLLLLALLATACAPQADLGTQPVHTAASPAPAPALAPLPEGGGGGGGSGSSPCLTGAKIQLTANPTSIVFGQSSRLSWSVRPPEGCGAPQVRLNGEAVATRGTHMVMPSRSTTFVLVAIETLLGQVAQTSASAQVDVGYPTYVTIDERTPDPVGVLIGALGSANPEQTVELFCNVDIDLTGFSEIEVDSNRLLFAAPVCARGPRSLGPRIFVTDHRGSAPLFDIRGDNIRFSGFRLEGPTSEIGQSDDFLERAILIWPFPAADPIHSVEISNMEIYYWSGSGVEVKDNVEMAERGRLFNTNVGAVHIHDNFFHHNRHGESNGYGVDSGNGAYALIERNVFDENRHAITGGVSKNPYAADYSGYTARDNLILAGGGVDCSKGWWWAILGWRWNCWHTQLIDMHGDGNEWYSDDNWECGTAGETIIVERNTVLYTNGLAIKIRGNPADKAVVDGNVFKQGSPSDAIAQNGDCGFGDNITKPIDVRPNNVFHADPMAQLGSCDFFGDGQEDQFMATGVTWWALSPVTHQWRYLNTMPELLPELQLAKFDADAVCDVSPFRINPVTAPLRYSKSGTSPWMPFLSGNKGF